MIITIVLDHTVSFGGGHATQSILDVPVGAATLAEHMSSMLENVGAQEIFAMRGHCPGRSAGDGHFSTVTAENLEGLAHQFESADQLLVIDPGRWPLTGFDLSWFLESSASYRGVTHAVAVGSEHQQQRELIDVDTNGYIRRIQRLYNNVNWPDLALSNLFMCLAPIRSSAGLTFESLAGLRRGLAGVGVLARDVPIGVDVVDLRTSCGLLLLNTAVLNETVDVLTQTNGVLTAGTPESGTTTCVHPSARIIGPVVCHRDVIVEQGATIIGPTVIGAAARIRRDAVVIQSIIGSRATVPVAGTIQQRVCLGKGEIRPAAAVEMINSADTPAPVPARGQTPPAPISWARHLQFGIKRMMDVVVSVLGLLILSPVLLVVAILIKLESPGPLFFVHFRETLGGKEFPCYKFRTMRSDAHRLQRELYKQNEMDGPQFKISNDPRVTRIGRWMRSTNIDELPQLINVVIGHMSLVGPRPSPFRENQICVPWRLARLSVRPGITGLWQICRSRSSGDFHEWIYYDMAYVRRFSLWLDFKILVGTVLGMGGQFRVPLSWMIRQPSSAKAPQLNSEVQMMVSI